MLVLAVVRVHEEHAREAAEDRAVSVVRFAVQPRAGVASCVVDDFVVERAHFNADRQAVA